MKKFKPITRFVALFLGDSHLVDKIGGTFGIDSLSDICAHRCTATEQLFGENKFSSLARENFVQADNAQSKGMAFLPNNIPLFHNS
jgi:hypothetical protein